MLAPSTLTLAAIFPGGAPRWLRQLGKGLSDGQHLGAARGVVERTVVDRVTRLVGLTDAKVVVVGGVDDHLVGKLGVRAPEQPGDIGRLFVLHGVGQGQRGLDPQRHRGEVAAMGRFDQGIQIVAGQRDQGAGGVFGQPGLHLGSGLITRRQLEVFTAP
jgi:hypothetical protein